MLALVAVLVSNAARIEHDYDHEYEYE